jgi:alkaline phosphatase
MVRGLMVGGLALAALITASLGRPVEAQRVTPAGSAQGVIFLHPDGMGSNTWTAIRLNEVGPDGALAWDELPGVALYKGPMLDSVTASSNGGATSHAWGVRAKSNSLGMIDGRRVPANRAGGDKPLMLEAKAAGKAIGIVNSASVTDAGTAGMIVSVKNRREHTEIAAQMLAAEPEVMLGGGEKYFLPTGVMGVYGAGARTDGRNLIEEARAKGYRVVRTKAELTAAVAAGAGKVLGLFAAADTFNEGGEEQLRAKGLPLYQPHAPRYDEMVAAALMLLEPAMANKGYFLVAEEEATDNFGGDNNAAGVLEAGAGADRAIRLAADRVKAHPNAMFLMVASDSDCGGLQASGDDAMAGRPLPARWENGAPVDGVGGTGGPPFLAKPNAQGVRLPFALSWASDGDMSGGGVVRWIGVAGAGTGKPLMDSTDVYTMLRTAVFPAGRD